MTRRARRLAAAYAAVVRLYPASFREAYGPAMRQAFADLLAAGDPAASAVLRELVPSLVAEHRAAGTLNTHLRGAVAAVIALAPCAACYQCMARDRDGLWLTTCGAAAAVAIARRGGRGLACTRDAVVASAATAGVGLMCDVSGRRILNPQASTLAAYVGVVATAALALSTAVRLVVEGLRVTRRPPVAGRCC